MSVGAEEQTSILKTRGMTSPLEQFPLCNSDARTNAGSVRSKCVLSLPLPGESAHLQVPSATRPSCTSKTPLAFLKKGVTFLRMGGQTAEMALFSFHLYAINPVTSITKITIKKMNTSKLSLGPTTTHKEAYIDFIIGLLSTSTGVSHFKGGGGRGERKRGKKEYHA